MLIPLIPEDFPPLRYDLVENACKMRRKSESKLVCLNFESFSTLYARRHTDRNSIFVGLGSDSLKVL